MGLFKGMKDMQEQAKQAAGNAGGMDAAMGGGDMAGQAAYAQTAQKLAASGIEAPGVIHAITPSGNTEFGGGQQVAFDVTVKPAEGEPYQTTINQSMLPAQMEGISEGQAITVKYDPDSPTSALIYGW